MKTRSEEELAAMLAGYEPDNAGDEPFVMDYKERVWPASILAARLMAAYAVIDQNSMHRGALFISPNGKLCIELDRPYLRLAKRLQTFGLNESLIVASAVILESVEQEYGSFPNELLQNLRVHVLGKQVLATAEFKIRGRHGENLQPIFDEYKHDIGVERPETAFVGTP